MTRPNLNRRLTLEAPFRTLDGSGGFVDSWQTLGTLWAQIVPRSGREGTGVTGSLSQTRFRITVRGAPLGHSNRPEPGQRFRMGPRQYRVDAVSEVEPAGLYLACDVTEETAA